MKQPEMEIHKQAQKRLHNTGLLLPHPQKRKQRRMKATSRDFWRGQVHGMQIQHQHLVEKERSTWENLYRWTHMRFFDRIRFLIAGARFINQFQKGR